MSKLKKLFSIICFLGMAGVLVAQTPQEILSRMDAEMDKHDKEGLIMTVDAKVPILGTMTTKPILWETRHVSKPTLWAWISSPGLMGERRGPTIPRKRG